MDDIEKDLRDYLSNIPYDERSKYSHLKYGPQSHFGSNPRKWKYFMRHDRRCE